MLLLDMNVLYTDASRPCTAALFLGDPLYGFINDQVKEKIVLLSSCAVWKGVCQVSGGQRGSRYVAAGLPLLDGSSQILPAAYPPVPGLGSDYCEFSSELFLLEYKLSSNWLMGKKELTGILLIRHT